MKKISIKVIYVLLFFILFSPVLNLKISDHNTVNAETKTVKIAFFNVPPHIYLDEKSGKMKGAFYELLENNIAPKMNVKFVWDTKPTVIPRQQEMLQNQDYAAALVIYTPERAQKFIFPKEPYTTGKTALVLLKSNKLNKVTKVDDLTGLTVGYASNAVISPFMQNDKVKFDLVSAANFNEVNFKKLLAKRIDAVYAPDKAGLLYYMREMKLENECKVIDLPEEPAIYNIAFSKSFKDVADKYSKVFEELNGSQLYLKILGKYIDTSKL